MELEHLKSIWQKTTGAEGEGYFISRKKVQMLIEKRSNTVVAQIKRGIRNKVWMAGSIGLLMIAFSILSYTREEPLFFFLQSSSNINVGIFYLVFGLVICFISVFNAYSYKKILNIEEHGHDLKYSLRNILSILQRAINVKIYSDTLVVPGTVLIFIMVDLVRRNDLFLNTRVLILSVLGALCYAVFAYFFAKRAQKKRYGAQIKALQSCLRDLEEE